MTEWYYARDKQRVGPVALEQMRQLVGTGELRPEHVVWTEGMSQWAPAGSVEVLFPGSAAAPAPTGAIGYYDAAAGLPPRAAATLRGHAPPAGDTGDWPLDDPHVAQFQEAVKLRKRVSGAANLYRALLLFSTIGAVAFLMISISTIAFSNRSPGAETWGTLMIGGASLGFVALYFFAARATTRSHRWAPLTMFIIYLAVMVLEVFGLLVNSGARRTPVEATIGMVLTLVFCGAFAAVSWRAFAAIPKYLRQPAWCQELIVKAGL
jgi:hypothetical protein